MILHAVGAAVAWADLPARIPIHFSFGGIPDAWADTSLLAWFGPVILAGAVLGVVYAVTTRRLQHRPGGEPNESHSLHAAERDVASCERGLGATVAVCLASTFLALQVGIYLTAHGHVSALPWYIELAIWAPAVLIIVSSLRCARRDRRAAHEASTSG